MYLIHGKYSPTLGFTKYFDIKHSRYYIALGSTHNHKVI